MKAFKFILVIFFVFLLGYLQNNAQSVITRQTKAKTSTTEKKHVSSQKSARNKSKKPDSNSHINSNQAKDKSKNPSILTISSPDGYINGYGYVDLGLPSGTKWATCNIGASSPQAFGNYYSWGETRTKWVYSYKFGPLTEVGCGNEQITAQICDPNQNLREAYDAAYINWGSPWRMPTQMDLLELIEKCTWIWITYNGKKVYKVVGLNGNSIFLPAAGYHLNTELELAGEWGEYWSATFSGGSTYGLLFRSNSIDMFEFGNRTKGTPIRSVIK